MQNSVLDNQYVQNNVSSFNTPSVDENNTNIFNNFEFLDTSSFSIDKKNDDIEVVDFDL